jgi:hypothetical protein
MYNVDAFTTLCAPAVTAVQPAVYPMAAEKLVVEAHTYATTGVKLINSELNTVQR